MSKKLTCAGYLTVAGLLLGGLAACGTDSTGSADGTSGAKDPANTGGNTIAYLQPLAADPAVQSITYGVKCAAAKSGDKVLLFDAGFDQNKQISQFDTAMTQGAAGIISHGVNSQAMYPSYGRAAKAKVPVLDFVGSDPNPPGATHTGEIPDGVAAVTVKALLEKFPTGGKVVMIGGPPAVAGVKPRQDAFIAAAKTAGLQIIGEEDSLTLAADDVQKKTSSLLLKHPDANIIWGVTAATAATAGQAAKQRGLAVGTDVVTIGAGASQDVAGYVSNGTLTTMVDTLNFDWGEALVGLLDDAIAGKPVTNPSLDYKAYSKADIASWVPPAKRCGS